MSEPLPCLACAGLGVIVTRTGQTTMVAPCLLCGGIIRVMDVYNREQWRAIIPKGMAEIRQSPIVVSPDPSTQCPPDPPPMNMRQKFIHWLAERLGVVLSIA